MSRNKIILFIGILTALMPFLGFPSSWKNIFYIVVGLILIAMAVMTHVRKRTAIIEERREVVTEVFVETNGERN